MNIKIDTIFVRYGKCIRRLCQTAPNQHCKALSVDVWRGYDGLVDIGFDKHFRVHHGDNRFASGERHTNGIESFWSFAKRRLAKFNGVSEHTFYLHLKESEFRFNLRRDNLYQQILKLLRLKPL